MKTLELSKILHQKLKPLWYVKKWSTWNINFGEVIWMFNLQKSQWGNQFYINIWLYLKTEQKNEFITYDDCFMKLWYRLERLIHDKKVPEFIDFEKLGESNWITQAEYLLEIYIVPFFQNNCSRQKITESYNKWFFHDIYWENYLKENGLIS